MAPLNAENWEHLFITGNHTIREAIQLINKSNGVQAVFLIDPKKRLRAVVVDGDIRRALIDGFTLDDHVSNLKFVEPTTIGASYTPDAALTIMRKNEIRQLPIVDNDNNMVGLLVERDLIVPARINNTFLIMAGGKGSRLGELTKTCPKPLLRVAGKPILQRIIENAAEQGFYKFLISVNYLGEMIKEYFGDGKNFGVNIDYIDEESKLGTAGPIASLGKDTRWPIVVLNGDIITEVSYNDLLEFHYLTRSDATMCVNQQKKKIPFGVVDLDGTSILSIREKPVQILNLNAGLYVIGKQCLSFVEKDSYCDMPDLFLDAIKNGAKCQAYPLYEQWVDVGVPEDFEFAKRLLEQNEGLK